MRQGYRMSSIWAKTMSLITKTEPSLSEAKKMLYAKTHGIGWINLETHTSAYYDEQLGLSRKAD